jgi:hypothetical protein
VLGTAAGLLSAGLVLLFTTHFVVDWARMRDYPLSFCRLRDAPRPAPRSTAWVNGWAPG